MSWWIVGQPWPLTHPTGIRTSIVSAADRGAAESAGSGAVEGGPFSTQRAARSALSKLQVPGSVQNNAGTGPSPTVTPGQATACLITNPFPFVSGCLFSKSNARAILGGLGLGFSGGVLLLGLGLVVAGGFASTKAGQSAGRAAGGALEGVGAGVAVIPGAEAAGAGIAAAGHGIRRQAGARQTAAGRSAGARRSSRRAAAASRERELMRTVGEPRENATLREGRGAVRETGEGTRRRGTERRAAVLGTGRAATRDEAGF